MTQKKSKNKRLHKSKNSFMWWITRMRFKIKYGKSKLFEGNSVTVKTSSCTIWNLQKMNSQATNGKIASNPLKERDKALLNTKNEKI